MPTTPYSAPAAAADVRTSDMASSVVENLLATTPIEANNVSLILHTQCTLDQQMLSSACLRIQHDHFPQAQRALTVAQLGTAGVGTALMLAKHHLTSDSMGRCVCISASDKWIAPFIRRHMNLVTYADAAAACLVEVATSNGEYVAKVIATEVVNHTQIFDFWSVSSEAHGKNIVHIATRSIQALLTNNDIVDTTIDGLIGDAYSTEISLRVAERVGLSDRAILPAPEQAHASSAAPLAAIHRGVQQANDEGKNMLFVIWTASLSGHAAAMLVRCYPNGKNSSDIKRTDICQKC